MPKLDDEAKKINDEHFEKFKKQNGIEIMKKAFDSLCKYEDEETRELFFNEIIDSLKEYGPFGAMKMLGAFKEIVGGTGFPMQIEKRERYGKKVSHIVLPNIEPFALKCMIEGTETPETVKKHIRENITDKQYAEDIISRLNNFFPMNGD